MTIRRAIAALIAGSALALGAAVATDSLPPELKSVQRSIRCRLTSCAFDPRIVIVPTSMDLAWFLAGNAADTRALPTDLSFESVAAMPFLPSGWNPPRQRKLPSGEIVSMINTRGPSAVVEVPIVEPGSLTITVNVAQVPFPKSPSQSLTFLWNDEFLVRHEVPQDGGDISLAVPLDRQHRGLNTLTMLPRFWLARSGQNPHDLDDRPGVEVRRIRFEAASAGSSAPPATVRDGNTIQQQAATVTSFYVGIPDAAILRGSIVVAPESGTAKGTAVLTLRRDGERDNVVGRWTAAELSAAGSVALNVDLASYAGQSVAVSLAVSGDGSSGKASDGFRVDWKGLRIDGTQSEIQKSPPQKPEKAPNVIVVLFDTLRADFTEPYGGREARTPNMNRLAASGVTFLNTTSNAASTRPSVATLLTGLVPTVHNVNILDTALSPSAPYLPSVLQEAGYVTIGVSDNPHISTEWGFARGFEHFTELSQDLDHQERRKTARPEELAAHTWATSVAPSLPGNSGAPFFLYLHEIDPHFPYDAPPPFDHPTDFGYRGALFAHPDGEKEAAEDADHHPSRNDEILASLHQGILLMDLLNRGRTTLGEADIRYIRSRYAAEVSYMDAYLGWIMNRLKETQLDRNTLFVFLSDHGEEFMEHGYWTHGPAVHEEAIRVPLIASMPGVLPTGKRSTARAELLDVVPTILDLAGVPPPPFLQGHSLVNHALTEENLTDVDPAFAFSDETFLFKNDGKTLEAILSQQSIQIGHWKLFRDVRTKGPERINGYSLFDLAADPTETVNRWASRPVTAHALRQTLDVASSMNAATTLQAPTPEIDEPARNRLRALGYLQ